jgi:hypothetical protein
MVCYPSIDATHRVVVAVAAAAAAPVGYTGVCTAAVGVPELGTPYARECRTVALAGNQRTEGRRPMREVRMPGC